MPPAAKAEEALRKQKEAKQKKLLIVLAPVLLLMLVWQGPGILKAFSGGGTPPVEEAVPAPASTTPSTAPDPSSAAAPSTATGGVATPTPAPTGAALPESDSGATAGEGQLVAFDRFVGKDPFRSQADADDNAATRAPTAPSGDKGGDQADDGTAGDPTTPPPSTGGGGVPPTLPPTSPPVGPAPTVATLDVNGTREQIRVNGTFPATDPIFRLVSLKKASVKIGLVTGEFSDGVETITLRRGKPLTLVSEPDGLRYVVTLVSTSTS